MYTPALHNAYIRRDSALLSVTVFSCVIMSGTSYFRPWIMPASEEKTCYPYGICGKNFTAALIQPYMQVVTGSVSIVINVKTHNLTLQMTISSNMYGAFIQQTLQVAPNRLPSSTLSGKLLKLRGLPSMVLTMLNYGMRRVFNRLLNGSSGSSKACQKRSYLKTDLQTMQV